MKGQPATDRADGVGWSDRSVVLASIAACLVLRLPWLRAPLEIDEGGLAAIGRSFSVHGPELYGRYFLDRPPLLPLVYAGAVHVAGATGIRILGAIAASALVLFVARTASAIGGSRALRIAAPMAAALVSARAIDSVYTDAELLAAVPAAASVWLLLTGSRGRSHGRMAASGVLASCALLVKQSFLDAGLIGVGVLLAHIAIARTPSARRHRVRMAATWGAAAAAPLGLAALFAALTPAGVSGLWYANFGFRTRAVHALQASSIPIHDRMLGLVPPVVGSGLLVLLVVALASLRRLARTQRFDAVVLAVWMLGMSVGVLGGGYYWPHYLIQAIAPVVVAASVGLASLRPWPRTATIAVALACFSGGVAFSTARARHEVPQGTVRSVAGFLRANRHVAAPTMEVLYARANLTWYADGLRSRSPWLWTSMYRVEADAQHRTREILSGGDRPTWLVTWQHTTSLNLDADGRTDALLRRNYRHVATICNVPILLRRDLHPRRLAAPRARCSSGQHRVTYLVPVRATMHA